MDILLTTYPAKGSKNVGDSLITQSAVELIKKHHPNYNPKIVFREQSLEKYGTKNVNSILAPGFSINNCSYPKLFTLYSKREKIKNFYPFGCSFQSVVLGDEAYEKSFYSPTSLDFLKDINIKSGAIPCRDEKIVNMLRGWGVKANYMGDLALYSQAYRYKMIEPVKEPRSIVFTIQHKPIFAKQSFMIIDMLSQMYKTKEKYISYHSTPNKNSNLIAEYAKKLGFKVLNLYGESENLNHYDDIDLHVGYRLHGHLYFLRTRKPSVLIIEDSRSYGISRSGALSLGTFMGLDDYPDSVDLSLVNRIEWFLEKSMSSGFVQYNDVFKQIDVDYNSIVYPYFSELAKKIQTGSL